MTYANVMASIAVFVAIGGTSYAALALPRDSVGGRQIKPRAVGPSDLRSGAVTSRVLRDGAVRARDMASGARDKLSGRAGPPGPPGPPAVELRAAVTSVGAVLAGNVNSLENPDTGKFTLGFGRGLDGCVPVASLARNGGDVTDPGPGHIVVSTQGDRVLVETYGPAGNATALPFNVIVTC